MGDIKFQALPVISSTAMSNGFFYALEVYVDNFISIIIPMSQEKLVHVAMAIISGIHDVFSVDIVDSNNPITENKLLKGEGQYTL